MRKSTSFLITGAAMVVYGMSAVDYISAAGHTIAGIGLVIIIVAIGLSNSES